ncbi:MAG TPA: phosphate ABC transporter substrate-binding protein PstS [Desulfocapsa sulfexigens]|nr:phosphate ABC transporter substrate-binding protein PstS [Desulfocapsa sulfexigens]
MIMKRIFILSAIALLTGGLLCGCGQDEDDEKQSATDAKVIYLHGAGATFPAPLYKKWIEEYQKTHKDVVITYDAVGSGTGTKLFMSEAVDFGASDSAMKDEQMAKVAKGVQLIPATAGSIVLAYNIPDIDGKLRLSRDLYIDIFLGKIRFWDDPRIKKENPDLKLPSLSIVTVVRSDSSGTTWAFTNHLSTISKAWRDEGPGTGKELDFPGNAMFGSGNGGVATKIKHSWGSIGYVEYGFAKRAGLDMATLENKAGKFIEPSDTSPTETLTNTHAGMPANLRLFLPDPEGETSYPIVTYSWLLLYKKYEDNEKWIKLHDFVRWGLTNGQQFGSEFGYAPLPDEVAQSALKAVDAISSTGQR